VNKRIAVSREIARAVNRLLEDARALHKLMAAHPKQAGSAAVIMEVTAKDDWRSVVAGFVLDGVGFTMNADGFVSLPFVIPDEEPEREPVKETFYLPDYADADGNLDIPKLQAAIDALKDGEA
jgi:hypothetical protein